MSKSLRWKVPLIVIVVGLAAFYLYPPKDRINLGLDLRGGSHIVMQVETQSAVKYEMDLTVSRIGQALKDKGLTFTGMATPSPGVLELKGSDPARRGDIRRVLDDYVGQWEVRDAGAGNWRVTMPPAIQNVIEINAVETTLTTIRNRIDELGVREPIVQKEGIKGDRILIQLPGVEDPERAKEVMQDPAVLEWKTVIYPPGITDYKNWIPPVSQEEVVKLFGGQLPPDTVLYPQRVAARDGTGTTSLWWPLNKISTIVGNDLKNALREQNQWGEVTVGFQLSQDAGRRFESATREYVGKKMAIVLGGVQTKQVISAPVIEDVIRDRGQIRGNFDSQSAEDLALKLRSGSIPTDVTIIEERTVGPSLGRDSIRAGIFGSLVGFLGVMLFMLVYYRASGINAVVALMLNVVLVMGAMGYFKATLTLPGIAGLILTVGMAVDSNVLIFERIREELGLGKTVRSAVDLGFSRAFMTIVDTHVTTLVSSFFLFTYGTGPVKGFAVTLTVGLIFSMFTAVFVSRVIFDFVLGEGRPVESLSI
jgi:preprotein translocase subunit SecD